MLRRIVGCCVGCCPQRLFHLEDKLCVVARSISEAPTAEAHFAFYAKGATGTAREPVSNPSVIEVTLRCATKAPRMRCER